MSVRIVPVIFARLDSQRLPGKVLKPLLNGKTIVEELVVQLRYVGKQVPSVAAPVIATTNRSVDEPIVSAASALDTTVSRGHLLPLIRLREISTIEPEDWLWRLNADSPLILQRLIERAAAEVPVLDDGVKIITNLVERSFPYGVSLEMFRADMIMGIEAKRATSGELEHLTPITQRLPPEGIRSIVADDLGLSPFDTRVRLTIDDAEDAAFFGSLWDDPWFQKTRTGSVERVEYAYQKRVEYLIKGDS
jgi:spore coat polysaccharide biosynthesis protein SpsF